MKNLKKAVLAAIVLVSITNNVTAFFGKGEKGNTELHKAVKKKDLNEVVGILNQNPGLVNVQNAAGNTPLHVAVSLLKGRAKVCDNKEIRRICSHLFKNGAKLEIKNKKSEVPLATFINVDEFNHSTLNEGMALLLLFYCIKYNTDYFDYYDKMEGFTTKFIKKYSVINEENLKLMLNDRGDFDVISCLYLS